jgi:hypothetical protein
MRRAVILALLPVLLLAMAAAAGEQKGESFCPAQRVAEKGQTVFEEFHQVMAPAWHMAWPKKDFDALFAVAPKFEKKFEAIAELKPELPNERRKAAFTSNRDELGKIVAAYAKAAAEGDQETVYELMPKLHDAFEQTASSLLPVHFPEIESALITTRLILETHLPNNNDEGVTGSTETLVTRVSSLNEEAVPEELHESMDEVTSAFAAMKTVVQDMKKCCDSGDMKEYEVHARNLEEMLQQFVTAYL